MDNNELSTNLAEVGTDLISRQAAIDMIDKEQKEIDVSDVSAMYAYSKCKAIIKQLPSELGTDRAVKGFPIDADDLMLRVEEKYGFRSRDRLYDIIRKMPKYELASIQPEIIYCGDCKYKDDGIDEDGIPFLKCLHGRSYGGTRINDFCSWAERREVTT